MSPEDRGRPPGGVASLHFGRIPALVKPMPKQATLADFMGNNTFAAFRQHSESPKKRVLGSTRSAS